MNEDYWFQEAGICRNPKCTQKLLNHHAGCCPQCGTWQDPDEDPGIVWESNVEFTGDALKEVFYKTQGGKKE